MAPETHPAPPEAPAQPFRWVMLGGLWLLYFSFGLTTTSLAPLIPHITRELGLSHTAMGSILGAWPLVYIAAAAPCGMMLDRIGPRRALFLAMMLIGLSGTLRGVASDYATLFAAVAVFGLGGPLVSVGAPKVIGLWFQGRERGLAIGVYATGQALGSISSLSLTNAAFMPLADNDWRAVLLGYAGFVFIAGFVWLGIASHAASRDVERRLAAEPRGPQLALFAELLRCRTVNIIMLLAMCSFFFNHSLNNWLPLILIDGGMHATTAGYWASLPTVIGLFGALAIPRLAVQARRIALLRLLYLCAGAASLLILTYAGPALAVGLVLQGIARSSMTPIAMLVLLDAREVGPRAMGAAGGLYFSAGEIGGVLGPLTVGYVSDVSGGFAAALYLLTGISVVLTLLTVPLKRLTS